MPKLIFRSNYMRDAPPQHLANYVKYIAFGDDVPEADALLRVEPGRGFVEDQDFRVVEQRLRNPDSPDHAAGKTAELFVCDIFEADQLQQGNDGFVGFAGWNPFQCGQVFQEPPRAEIPIDTNLLRHVAELVTVGRTELGDVHAVELNAAGGRRQYIGHHPHQGGFSCAVRTEQTVHASLKLGGEILHRVFFSNSFVTWLSVSFIVRFLSIPDDCFRNGRLI